jgi:hypothetical protein
VESRQAGSKLQTAIAQSSTGNPINHAAISKLYDFQITHIISVILKEL